MGEQSSAKKQTRLFVFVDEVHDDEPRIPQDFPGFPRGAIRGTEPDDLRRRASENASLLEIGVFRNDGETTSFGVFPNCFVSGASQAAGVHMRRTGINVGERFHEAWRKIFVKKELHAREISSLRSRSAAKARQA